MRKSTWNPGNSVIYRNTVNQSGLHCTPALVKTLEVETNKEIDLILMT